MPPEIHGERTEIPEYKGTNDYQGNPTIPEQFVNAFIEEKRENENKIPVHR